MRLFVASLLTAVVTLYGAAQAQDNPVIVELYTSQGCSSCPPADKFLQKLASNSNVIALALHVDYWDYLGWKDTFSNSGFTQRQRSYARAAHKRTIYTPQMVIQGVDHVIGTRENEVRHSIAVHRLANRSVDLQISRVGNVLTVKATPTSGNAGATVVQLVRYVPGQSVNIKRGENAGRQIEYINIVVDWQVISNWNGRSTFSKVLTIAGAEPVVVIIQKPDHGAILAAARLQ